MKRTHLNALIDGLAFVAFLFLLTTGLLLEYQLPARSGGLQGHGTGQGASVRSVGLVMGLTRHEWGQIHYWIALAMLAVLAFHLLLHWKWIVCTARGKPSTASGYRLTLGVVGLVFTVLLSAVPLLSGTSVVSRIDLRESRTAGALETDNVKAGSNTDSHEMTDDSTSVRGSMTLRQISDNAGVTVADLVSTLGLPPDVDVDTGAGRLMRQHGLTMSDLRKAINTSHNSGPTPSNK
jgi:Domain of unknown function (DUF4405)